MLSSCWLLTDLDGTLISTPHKARGRYLSLAQSPCRDPVRRWLLNGGNICVVTTADLRVVKQMYLPLKSTLEESARRVQAYHKDHPPSAAADEGDVVVDLAGTEHHNRARHHAALTAYRQKTSKSPGGTLLLSLYTGAVLYECTAKGVEIIPGYVSCVHCATSEAAELTRLFDLKMPMEPVLLDGSSDGAADNQVCVRGTCISYRDCVATERHIERVYTRYLKEILSGEPEVLAGVRKLSARYKRLWCHVLCYLDLLYHFRDGSTRSAPPTLKHPKDDSILYEGATQNSPEAIRWKVGYWSSRESLLSALGLLRFEYVETHVICSDSASEEKQERAAMTDHILKVLSTHLPPEVCAVTSRLVRDFAAYLATYLCTHPGDVEKRENATSESAPDVAQVILLGIPLSLYQRYFADLIPVFVRSGLNAMPQPNSVVFSKMGVSKSTALRYLLGKDRVASVISAASGQCRRSYANTVKCATSIAMGDNPHTTDYELTVFSDLTFASVEMREQRERRHARIAEHQRNESQNNSDHQNATSRVAQGKLSRRSGPLMDDRTIPNVHYVGGEEDGTAVLLTKLMQILDVPELNSTTGSGSFITEDQFSKALAEALPAAQRVMKGRVQSKL